MIGVPASNGLGAVDLLYEEKTGQFMGKGELGKRDFLLTLLENLLGEALCSSNEENDTTAFLDNATHPFRESDRSMSLSPLRHNYHMASTQLFDFFEQGFALSFFIFCRGFDFMDEEFRIIDALEVIGLKRFEM